VGYELLQNGLRSTLGEERHENILVGVVSRSLLSLKNHRSIQTPGQSNIDKRPTLIAASLSLAMV
jgi:hypothetical protein